MAIHHKSRRLLAVMTVSAGVALWRADAMAQSAIVDELRPLYANSDDIRDGKELADSTCAKCHGADGVSTTGGVPNLAGQRPSYVYRELKAYQGGDPTGGGEAHNMKLMKFLSDEALANLAAYYASSRSRLAPRCAGAEICRSGRGRQGGGGALREMPRRKRRQSQGGRAKFDRSSSEISRGDDAVL